MTDAMRDETKLSNQAINSGMLKAVQDPTEVFIVPKPKENVPFLDFSPLQNAIAKLQESVSAFEKASEAKATSAEMQAKLDAVFIGSERLLTREEGLPRRDWFRHQIYAPGFYTGYGVKTLPGIREAIEQRDWKEAQEQIAIVSATIERFVAEIDRAAKL